MRRGCHRKHLWLLQLLLYPPIHDKVPFVYLSLASGTVVLAGIRPSKFALLTVLCFIRAVFCSTARTQRIYKGASLVHITLFPVPPCHSHHFMHRTRTVQS